MNKVVFLNGKFLSTKEAKVSFFTPGLLSGWGLFETMRAYGNKIVYFNAHLKRIKDSSKLIGINLSYPLATLKKIIKKVVEINSFINTYVRLTLWKSEQGSDILVIAKKYQPHSGQKYRKGFSAKISRFKQNEDSFLARIKTTNRLLYELSFQEARAKGFDEAIILNYRGYIAEATRSNIFLVKNKELFTPALECGCLDGITRRVIVDLAKSHNFKIYEGNFTTQDLTSSDEAFLTNSLIGVMPLSSLEGKPIGDNRCGRLTQFFIKKYRCLLK